MSYQVFPTGPIETNAYIIFCTQTRLSVIIDPAYESFQKIQAFIEQNQLIPYQIWLTHSHWDHIADLKSFKENYSLPIGIHALDQDNLIHPGSDQLPCPLKLPSIQPDFFFSEGQEVFLGNQKAQIIHTPGHSPGSVCFYFPQEKLLFSGDTLFKGSIGNLSFPTAQPDLMWDSLEQLLKLPSDTKVLPGHGFSTTLSQESWLPRAKQLFS